MPLQGSAPRKWSLTGLSDWTYCVQNVMSEAGLQGKGLYVMKPLPHTLPFLGDHQKEKQRQRSHRQECQRPGWIWHMLPFAKGLAQCPPSPILAIPSRQPHGVVSGATEGKRGGSVLTHNLTVRSNPCQRVPYSFPKFPEALASLDTATTGTPLCHFPRHWQQAA